MKHALIALLLGATCGTTGAQSLGRLFYSEAERAQLEQQRGKALKFAILRGQEDLVGTIEVRGRARRQ